MDGSHTCRILHLPIARPRPPVPAGSRRLHATLAGRRARMQRACTCTPNCMRAPARLQAQASPAPAQPRPRPCTDKLHPTASPSPQAASRSPGPAPPSPRRPPYVVAQAVVEEHRVLRHHSHRCAQAGQRYVPQVSAIDAHAARLQGGGAGRVGPWAGQSQGSARPGPGACMQLALCAPMQGGADATGGQPLGLKQSQELHPAPVVALRRHIGA